MNLTDRELDLYAARIIARRIMRDVPGTDFSTAMEMVTDVHERGADSPDAEIVSNAAWAVIEPVYKWLTKWAADSIAALESWAAKVGETMRPVFEALAKTETRQ